MSKVIQLVKIEVHTNCLYHVFISLITLLQQERIQSIRERKTIIDIRLNQKTIVIDYSATRLTVATQQTFAHLFQNTKTLLLENTCVTPTIRKTKILGNNLPFLRNVRVNLNAQYMKCSLSKKGNLSRPLNLTQSRQNYLVLIITPYVPHFN